MKKVFFFFLIGCKEPHQNEDYGDVSNSPGGAVIQRSEHRGGYASKECLLCHNINNIHQKPSSPINSRDLNELVRRYGVSQCLVCHGKNGTE